MKKLYLTGITILAFSTITFSSIVSFEIVNEKEKYTVNDTVIVKVSIKYTHRQCEFTIEQTEFQLQGLKLLKATKWKELNIGNYERKVMLVIDEETDRSLTVQRRKCSKEGTYGKLIVK